MKMLLETGASSEIQCPYCNYTQAMDNYESRGGAATYKGKDYHVFKYCPVCDWTQYGDKEDKSGEITIKPKSDQLLEAEKIVKFYKKTKDRAAYFTYRFLSDNFSDYKVKDFSNFKQGLAEFIFIIFARDY